MPLQDNTKQNKKIKNIRAEEEELFVQKMAKRFGLKYIDLGKASIETDALGLMQEKEARNSLAAPFHIVGKELHIAMKSPNFPATKKVLDELNLKYNVTKYLSSTRSLEKAWGRYADLSLAEKSKVGILEISPESLEKYAKELKKNEDIADRISEIEKGSSEHRVTEIMQVIFGGSIATDASDVHFEPQEERVRLRLRQDGLLQDITFISPKTYKQLLTRLKILSKMKITRTANAQDGRFTIEYKGVDVEIRVSVVPSAYGEAIVMRILNPKNIRAGIEDLGMETKLYKTLLKEIKKPTGLILNTGPTGSGKTTTLYAFLKKVYTPDKKILTIEDPIEYHLEGISQTQVNNEKGYDFLHGLRAAMRQDPDIIMVGEIRDKETARIAVNAALTGHLVLSTLHTNNAAGVIPRLLDLGVSSHILAAALSVSIAQRLVRKICESCKKEVEPTDEEKNVISGVLKLAEKNKKDLSAYGISTSPEDIKLWKGEGCEVCNQTGYKGRIGIFEVILTTDELEALLTQTPSEQDIRKISETQGLPNLQEDGVLKILKGITSFEEVNKVINLETDIVQAKDGEKKSVKKEKNISRTDGRVRQEEGLDELIDGQKKKIESKRTAPDSVLNTKELEVSLLVDYLKKLEEEQIVDPDIDATEKIQKTQGLILEILKTNDISSIFKGQEIAQVHDEVSRIMDDLKQLEREQKENPEQNVAKRLKRIRHEIEAL